MYSLRLGSRKFMVNVHIISAVNFFMEERCCADMIGRIDMYIRECKNVSIARKFLRKNP